MSTDAPAAAPRPWLDEWFTSAAGQAMTAWRGVESQTGISTLKLVDTREEHDALEAMLEASKPPKPEGGERLHYLLFTPLRYTSPHPSRFRGAAEAGIWYGADSVEAACAEIACWRYRFIIQSAGLARDDGGLTTSHTLFKADVQGAAIDLTRLPWSERSDVWMHPSDYAGTQSLAAEARHRGLEWIRYPAVRHPGATCAAVLAASALSNTSPSGFQEWHCRATRRRVMFHNRDSALTYSWDF